jgi:hypothetical protein
MKQRIIALTWCLLPALAWGITLQQTYDAAAGGSGYDKVITLERGQTYTGGLTLYDQRVCLHGNGAVMDLQGGSVDVSNGVLSSTRLDVDHGVFINGGIALNYWQSANGQVRNCTFYNNTIAVKMFYCTTESSSISNCIFAANTQFAVLVRYGIYPAVAYNCCWGNGGDYFQDCGCPVEPYSSFAPAPGTGLLSTDPLLANPAQGSFALSAGSPCIGSGDPAGTDMGAWPYSAGIKPAFLVKHSAAQHKSWGPNPVRTLSIMSPGIGSVRYYSVDGKLVSGRSAVPAGWYIGVVEHNNYVAVRPLVLVR